MEKSWENFWTTGKVEDYLNYRNCVTDDKEEKETDGTVGDRDRNGTKCHADFRIR